MPDSDYLGSVAYMLAKAQENVERPDEKLELSCNVKLRKMEQVL